MYHAFSLPLLRYLIPLYLFSIPCAIEGRINIRLSMRDAMAGFMAAAVLLIPFYLFLSMGGRGFTFMPVRAVLFQLLAVSLPEEVYFRGFLQERLGNNVRGLLIVSVMFSIMHLPQFIFYNDPYPLLTFFPSLVMGLLYMKSSNVLPSTIFHFLSNVVFLGFML